MTANPAPARPTDNAAQVRRLTALLQLEIEARRADDPTTLGFVIVNETQRVLPYASAFFWRARDGAPRIEAISAISSVDRDTPFVRWMGELARVMAEGPRRRKIHEVVADVLPEGAKREEWGRWIATGRVLWLPFPAKGGAGSGLILVRPDAWREADLVVGEHIADLFAHAERALGAPRKRAAGLRRWRRAALLYGLPALLAAVLLLPVHISAIAPAEVIARDSTVVTAPFKGVIKSIEVRPSAAVAQGQVLFTLDDTEIRTKHEVAQRARDLTRAELLRASQKAFTSNESKAEIELLRVRLELRQTEIDYYAMLLRQLKVAAPRDGVAVFSDPNDWIGRPVEIGQKVMSIADPSRTRLQIWLPVADAINLAPGAEVSFFMHVAPLRPLAARLVETSYEAETSPAQVLAYRLRADFAATADAARLGLNGSAKLYGERVTLFYYIFRRPIAALRQTFGW
jgi:hypothetical protein